MKTPAYPSSEPRLAIVLEPGSAELGQRLALALADLGESLLLRGPDAALLGRTDQAIAARWCKAAVDGGAERACAVIRIVPSIAMAVAHLHRPAAERSATEILLVMPDEAGNKAELQMLLDNLEPDRAAHAVLLQAADASIPALARTCRFLGSSSGRTVTNLMIPVRPRAMPSAAAAPRYPYMSVCAPAVAVVC